MGAKTTPAAVLIDRWCGRCGAQAEEVEVEQLGQRSRLWKHSCTGCSRESLPYGSSERARIRAGKRPVEDRRPSDDWRKHRWDLDRDEREDA